MSQTRIKIKKNKKEKSNRTRGAKYWMAVGTMAAYATFNSDAVFKVQAQQSGPTAPAANTSGQTQGVTVRRFDIPPGTLDLVLPVFEKTAQFHVTVPRDSMRGIWSPGVSGLYTPEGALQKLLTGTGIGYHSTGPDQVVLEVQGMATRLTSPTPACRSPYRNSLSRWWTLRNPSISFPNTSLRTRARPRCETPCAM